MKRQKQTRVGRVAHAMVNYGLLAACLSFGSANAAVTFQFQYADPAGTGFLDPADGSSRQTALNTAASKFSDMFGSHFSNSGTVVLQATASDDANDDTLASAGSKLINLGGAGFNLGEVVRTKLLTGTDLNGNNVDGSLDVNFGNFWELDFNATPSNTEYDFYSALFHEFTHALGFTSTMGQSGEPIFGTQDTGSWSTFDSFLTDKNGARIIDPANFALNQETWNAASIGGPSPAGGLFFDGANAVAANGGSPVGLYTPTTWEEGSSVSHLDDENPALAGRMMLAASEAGPYARDYDAVEVGMLADLGYTVAAIPEPETYAMLLAGLGMIGWVVRRRKAA
ncbi:PEP-CTERM protein-sorting domain-containing protein [Nitrosospira sp. Nl5]|uniref:PEP-CTERM sorting domain-containing protein n=1 Tax=Nitrosospira sp. Nl5 TaxID=200120 RepID=UPI00087FF5D7|nr:PEP-CTERM sorting domain-containing protein [Nitrosospira sp. Nl5]SCX90754.1 PEP-CTERM protein-sorting domain-containing protein [Nitrosospira sp. Nl5]